MKEENEDSLRECRRGITRRGFLTLMGAGTVAAPAAPVGIPASPAKSSDEIGSTELVTLEEKLFAFAQSFP